MIMLSTQQGSLEWLRDRLYRLTASGAKSLITSTGKLSKSKTAIKAIDKLIAGHRLANVMAEDDTLTMIDEMDEWELKKFMSNYVGDVFKGNLHTERGHDCEADAMAALSEIVGQQFQDVGMCVMGDSVSGVISCSPDGVLMDDGKMIAGGEVKSLCLCNYYGVVVDGILPPDHKLQCHLSMAVCGVDTWHFGVYFKDEPLFYVPVKWDSFTDAIKDSLQEFEVMYAERYETVTNAVKNLKKL